MGLLLLANAAFAAEKPCITYKAPPPSEDDRPVATAITVGPQGSDYAFKVDFNRAPWGDECGTRCANTTIFLDTDNDKNTGLKSPVRAESFQPSRSAPGERTVSAPTPATSAPAGFGQGFTEFETQAPRRR